MNTCKLKLGISGAKGSFSEEAALQYITKNKFNFSLQYLMDMENVLAAIHNNRIDFGIFPVVNPHGGLVKMAFEAMGKYFFQMIDEVWLQVNHCLLVQPNIEQEQITRIVSHRQALAQCRHYIKDQFPNAKKIVWSDTAKAAEALACNEITSLSAVIAPQRCREIYNLKILASNIQDTHPNLTAFIVVRNRRIKT